MDAEGCAVAVHLRLVGRPLQGQGDAPALPVPGDVQLPHVAAHHLVVPFIAVVHGELLHRVGDPDLLQLLQPLLWHAVQASCIVICVVPVVIDLIAHDVPPSYVLLI